MKRFLSTDGFVLTVIAIAVICVHGAFMVSGFGEPDAARLVNEAIIWRDNPDYLAAPETEYRPRILPLSIIMVRYFLPSQIDPPSFLLIFNSLNLPVGAFMVVFLFLVWRRLTSRPVAYTALAFVSVMPVIWVQSLYAYPHGLSFTLFVLALYVFLLALDRVGAAFVGMCLLSTAILGIGLGFKADIVIAGGAFPGALWALRRLNLQTFVAATLIVCLAILVPYALHGLITDTSVGAVSYAQKFHRIFPASVWNALRPVKQLEVISTTGWVLALAIIGSLIWLLRRPDDRRLVVFVLAWAVPIGVYWGLHPGIHARHFLAAAAPMALLPAVLIHRIPVNMAARCSIAAALIFANYFLGEPKGGINVPSPRLMASARLFEEGVASLHARADVLAQIADPKVALVGTWHNPWAIFPFLAKARSVRHVGEWQFDLELPDGSIQRFVRIRPRYRKDAPQIAADWRAQGYRVISLNYDPEELETAP